MLTTLETVSSECNARDLRYDPGERARKLRHMADVIEAHGIKSGSAESCASGVTEGVWVDETEFERLQSIFPSRRVQSERSTSDCVKRTIEIDGVKFKALFAVESEVPHA